MKLTLLRSMVLGAVALGLAACGGGGDDDYVISGRFIAGDGSEGGVIYEGMQLANGSDVINVPAGAKKFEFPTRLGYGDRYAVSVKNQPAHQACSVLSPALEGVYGSDVAGRLTTIDVVVQCKIQTHLVTVAIPKAADGLVLTNGADSRPLAADTTQVSFTVQFGQSYGITILKPPGTVCKVENGVGIMGDADITNVKLVCP